MRSVIGSGVSFGEGAWMCHVEGHTRDWAIEARGLMQTRIDNAERRLRGLKQLDALLEERRVWEALEDGHCQGAAEALWLMLYSMP